jgi:hypothetical protein
MFEKDPLGPAMNVLLELHHADAATGALVDDWNER